MSVTEARRVPRKPRRNDDVTKIDKEVLRLARIVAAYRDITIAEYISERLRPLVQQDLADHARLQAAAKGDLEEPAPKPRSPRKPPAP